VDAAERFAAVHRDVQREREAGRLGFFDLTDQPELLAEIREYAASVRGAFDDLVVLGIGGSALGTRALGRALLHPFWNELSAEARGGRPRLQVLDNVDPSTIAPLLERLDPPRTLVNVVSKSGTTAETRP
jgi:glucose-6-phosphate isomerase